MKYKNLKDVFFDSKYHVGKGMATYDKSLDKAVFDALADLQSIAASEVAMDAIAASKVAMDAIIASEVAMDAIAASKVAMDAIIASEVAMDAIVASKVAMDAIVASEVAMDAVFNSLTAKTAIFGKDTATQAIKDSQYAIDWLKSNKGVEASGWSTSKETIYNGKALLIEQWDSTNNSGITIRYGEKVGTVGVTDRSLSTTKINNVMACNPLTMQKVGGTTGISYCIYVPMDK